MASNAVHGAAAAADAGRGAAAGAVCIPRRFNGPPASANGGVACGLVAARLGPGPASVTLRRPPPLGVSLPVELVAAGRVAVTHDGALVAEASVACALDDVEPPVRPSPADAEAAMARHPWLGAPHALAECFVCGAARSDGLGLHFGRVPRHGRLTAAIFRPDATVPHDDDGVVAPEIVWGALDCPSYTPEIWDAEHPSLLARLDAELLAPVHVGDELIATGWPLETAGRKHYSASALLRPDGTLVARARALWIRLTAPLA